MEACNSASTLSPKDASKAPLMPDTSSISGCQWLGERGWTFFLKFRFLNLSLKM